MSLAQLTNIHKSFGQRIIFEGADLTVYEHERVGLIGANGSGKTTLFKILTGAVEVESGTVVISKGVKVGHLAQDPVFDPGNTLIDEAELAFSQLHDLSHRLRDLEHAMAGQTGEGLEKVLAQYTTAQHDFDLAGGYAWRHRLEATLLGVGLPKETWEQPVETLSGGQRSRLALAKLLISDPDLLLLDEPTNHLDLAAIEWLEKYLTDFAGSVIIISHDRFLLDRLAGRIVWLNQRKLDSFKGNYSSFVEQRDLLELTRQRAYQQQQAYIDKQAEYIRRFQAGQRARQAKGRLKRLDTLLHSDTLIQRNAVERKIHLSIDTDQRAGDQVLGVKGLTKAFVEGRPLWKDLAFHVRRGDRVGMIGPNGSGKTTLLRVLLGEEDADAGDLRWGANLNIGYYDQRLDDFDPDATVYDTVLEGRSVNDKQLRDVLATMLFREEDVLKEVGLLSGGERARVRFAQLLLDKPNVLVLDEPTNHLDIASCEALEQTLAGFPGTILCVSHDRYFLNKVATRMLVLRPPGIEDFPGNYSAWAARQAELAAAEQEARSSSSGNRPSAAGHAQPPAKPRVSKKDNPYLRPFGRLSLEELEGQIQETEEALAECQADFGDPELMRDHARAKLRHAEFEALGKKLQQLEEEYFAREA